MLATLTQLGPGILVEDKGYSLALHYRLAPDLGPALQAAVVAICDQLPAGMVEFCPAKLSSKSNRHASAKHWRSRN